MLRLIAMKVTKRRTMIQNKEPDHVVKVPKLLTGRQTRTGEGGLVRKRRSVKTS